MDEKDLNLNSQDNEENTDWDFDGEVQTELDEIELPYSGLEVEPKEQTNTDDIKISKTSLKKVMVIIISVIAAIAIAVGICFVFIKPNSSEVMTPVNVAFVADGEKISVGEYNYYYNTLTSEQYMSQYAMYYGLDTEKPFETQYYDKEKKITWADYFENSTIEQISYIKYLAHKAKGADIKLTEQQEKEIEDNIKNISVYAENTHQSSNQYIAENYGENVGKKTIRKIFTDTYLAMNYSKVESVNKEFENKDIEKYKKDNYNDLLTVSFRYLPFQYEEDNNESKSEAKAKAEAMLAQELTDDNFLSVAENYVTDDYKEYLVDYYTKLEAANLKTAGLPSQMSKWLDSSKRKLGDKAVIDADDKLCYYVVVLTKGKSLDETKQYSVRHILIQPEADGEKESTKKQWAAAKKEADRILKEFKNSKGDEYAFAELAELYSIDKASTSEGGQGSFGGLYTAVSKGEMVEEFENWSLDESRKYADTDIVKTLYGYHIMYFISSQEGWKYTVEYALESKQQEETAKSVKNEKKMGIKKTTVAKPISASDNEK